MDAISAENINMYFDLLRSVYDENEFDKYPETIYNMDETGVTLEPWPSKILARKVQRKFSILFLDKDLKYL